METNKGKQLYQDAEEMAESIINGNLNHVVGELLNRRGKAVVAYLAVEIVSNLREQKEQAHIGAFATALWRHASNS